jgi:hypothetical protein
LTFFKAAEPFDRAVVNWLIKQARAAGVAEERTACIHAVCDLCRQGTPGAWEWRYNLRHFIHRWKAEPPFRGGYQECPATPIRARVGDDPEATKG